MSTATGVSKLALVTTGLTLGPGARAYTVGAAGRAFQKNPLVVPFRQMVESRPDHQVIWCQRFGAGFLDDLPVEGPQDARDFAKMFATTGDLMGIQNFIGACSVFKGLEFALLGDKKGQIKMIGRMLHAAPNLLNIVVLMDAAEQALAWFEADNPGREEGTILSKLAKATHEKWLEAEKNESYFVPYAQPLHDLIVRGIKENIIQKPMELHADPRQKFKLTLDNFSFPNDAARAAFAEEFQRATGRALDNKIRINTVSGEWDELIKVRHPGHEEAWEKHRSVFLFKLQISNVAAVLFGLEDFEILMSLSEGSQADKLQSLIEMLRIINVSWRINNAWDADNSPLHNKPFALKEDGGIGIDDILKDAVTLKSTLDGLEVARVAGRVNLTPAMAEGLRQAFANGLGEVLELMLDKEALAEAVRINTQIYNGQGVGPLGIGASN